MSNHTTGAQRYNAMKDKIFDTAHKIERDRIAKGEKPNPNLTDVKKSKIAKKMIKVNHYKKHLPNI